MLDELVARLSAIEHRLLADGDRLRFAALVATLFGPRLAAAGWDPEPGESRTRSGCAGRRRCARSASSRGARASSTRRRRASTAGPAATAPRSSRTCTTPAVAMAARAGDAARFERFRALFAKETDPAFRRR